MNVEHDCELAWAAGLYEGEGSVSVLRKKGSTRAKVQLCLSSTDEDVVRRFAAAVGVGGVTGPYQRRGNRKPIWSWRAHGWEFAEHFLAFARQFLGRRRIAQLEEAIAQRPTGRKYTPAHNRKLSNFQIREIRRRLGRNETQASVVRDFGISQSQVWKIKERRTYLDVSSHSHCPKLCEHPQPFEARPTKQTAEWFYLDPSKTLEFCGRCWHVDDELSVMVPCTPDTCT